MRLRIYCTTIALALLGSALPASAQTPTGYQLRIYMTGAAAPVTTYDIGAGAVACGQSKTAAPGTVTNPTTVRWDDPANAALDCGWTDPGTGPLFALPFSLTNTYTSRLVALNAAGASPESLASNSFTRPGLPLAAPGNVRMVRP